MLKIWTIIVTFNGEKWIGKCLNSLLNSSVHTNITVIDNMSSDRTLPIIKGSYPEVYLIENQKNWGFGKANNTGIRLALQHDADFVFLINQDAWIEPDVIKHLMEISISGFAPLFFHYYEDDDYVHRVIYHGLKIGICTGVSFCHARDIYTVRSKSKIDIIKKKYSTTILKYY